jgi:hypothetical protein
MPINNLPTTFPTQITIQLREGGHNGQQQLWAAFTHEGKLFKLVLSSNPRDRFICNPGETWRVDVHNSPNGHIVFCRPVQLLRTAAGEHPSLAVIKNHILNEMAITFEMQLYNPFKKTSVVERGKPSAFRVENDTLSIDLTDVVSIDTEAASQQVPATTVHIPLDQALWFDRNRTGKCQFSWSDSDGTEYTLLFEDYLWDLSYELPIEGDGQEEEDFDEEAYDRYRERQEELYWENEGGFSDFDD